MSTTSMLPDAEPTNAMRWSCGVRTPLAPGWKAIPAPSSNESYLPCSLRWNGSLTDAKYDWSPCDATVRPVRSSAMPKFRSDALSVRSWMVTSGERSEEHTSELQSHVNLVCRLLLEKKKSHMGYGA